METIIVICVSTVVGGIVGLRGRKYQLQRNVSARAKTARTPRDLGALVLIERFGQDLKEKMADKIAEPDTHPDSHAHAQGAPPPSIPAFTVEHPEDPYAMISAAAQGAWFGKDALQNLLEIDEHVYVAMSQLAGQQLETIGDLHTSIAAWPSSEVGEALSEGALNKLMGHLAEPIVGQHLEDLGVQVEMPIASNQPGYDLILNGEHAVNVKTVADISSLSAHFEKYPDIPVIVPSDMAGIPKTAIHLDASDSIEQLNRAVELGDGHIVLVDDALSHVDMLEHADGVSDALIENVDVIGIPLITLALSSYHQIKLLKQHDTDTSNALKNIGLDVAGTGAGGAAGAATGAAIGSAIVPVIGTALGAIVGGIVGAMGGRAASNSIREKPFRDALRAYQEVLTGTQQNIEKTQADADAAYADMLESEQNGLAQTVESRKRKLLQQQDILLQERRDGYSLDQHQAGLLLETTLVDLDAHIESTEAQLSEVPSWKRMVWPDEHAVLLQQSIQHLRKLSHLVQSQAQAILGSSPTEPLKGDQAHRFLQILLAVDGATPPIQELIRAHENRRVEREAQWRDHIEQIRFEVADRRQESFQKIATTVKKLQRKSAAQVKPLVARVEAASETVRKAAARLGKSTDVA